MAKTFFVSVLVVKQRSAFCNLLSDHHSLSVTGVKGTMSMCTASPREVFLGACRLVSPSWELLLDFVAGKISIWAHSLCVLLLPQPVAVIRAVQMISEVSLGWKKHQPLSPFLKVLLTFGWVPSKVKWLLKCIFELLYQCRDRDLQSFNRDYIHFS